MIAPKWRHDGFVITSSSYSDIFYHFLYIFLPVWFVIYLWLYICDVILVSLCIYGIMMFLRFYGFKYRFFSFFWRYFFQKHIWKIQYIFLKVSNIMTSVCFFHSEKACFHCMLEYSANSSNLFYRWPSRYLMAHLMYK